MIKLIVAYSQNRVIGLNNSIPWDLPEDRKFFKRQTLYHPVIMGRKTMDSLPNPLKNRMNIVVSSQSIKRDGFFIVRTPEDALTLAKAEMPSSDVFVIGGQKIYEHYLSMDIIDLVVASELAGKCDGDSFFPSLEGDWNRRLTVEFTDFAVVEYERVRHDK